MADLVERSREELETLKLAAEIEQLRANTENARKPRGIVDRYALPIAAIVGGLSGLAALGNAAVQFLEIDSLRAKDYADQLRISKDLLSDQQEKKANIARLEIQSASLQTTIASQRTLLANTSIRASQLKSALALRGGATELPKPTIAAVNQPQIDLFISKLERGTERGHSCADQLRTLGYYVRSINSIEQGPRYDKIIYFWNDDAPIVKALQQQLSRCGLSVPDGNLILVDPRSDYDTGKVAPRRAFEVWTSVGPSGTG